MVLFEEKKLVIEIATCRPSEAWMDLHKGICDMVRSVNSETITNESFFAVVDFLRELMPDYDVTKLMIRK